MTDLFLEYLLARLGPCAAFWSVDPDRHQALSPTEILE
jgi:hypothetical protein